MKIEISEQFCAIIDFIYGNTRNTNFEIRSGKSNADPFRRTTGVPQGCKLSSLLFSLYVSGLPCILHKKVQN